MKESYYPFEIRSPASSSAFFPSEYISLMCFINCEGFLEKNPIERTKTVLLPASRNISFQISRGKIIGLAFPKDIGFAPAVYQNQSTCSIFNNEEIQIADVSSNMVRLLQSLISLIQNEKEELSIPDLTVMINVISHSIFFKDVSPGLIKRDVVSKAIDLIAKNYASPLTLKEVADQLFVNPSYLSCTFHRKTGVTFSSYLLDVRLTAAKDQLLTTNELISTVSVNSGFSSSAYFISCFKKKYGLTPYAFRKNSIKKSLE